MLRSSNYKFPPLLPLVVYSYVFITTGQHRFLFMPQHVIKNSPETSIHERHSVDKSIMSPLLTFSSRPNRCVPPCRVARNSPPHLSPTPDRSARDKPGSQTHTHTQQKDFRIWNRANGTYKLLNENIKYRGIEPLASHGDQSRLTTQPIRDCFEPS